MLPNHVPKAVDILVCQTAKGANLDTQVSQGEKAAREIQNCKAAHTLQLVFNRFFF